MPLRSIPILLPLEPTWASSCSTSATPTPLYHIAGKPFFSSPTCRTAHNNLGNALRALGQLAEARLCYGEAIRLKPEMAPAHVNLAQTLQQEGHWDEALPCLRRATELEPNSLVFLALLAEATVERELFEEAIVCYQRMLALDSTLAATHNALGWLLQEVGRLDESVEHLRKCLSLRPDLAIAHVNLGGIHEIQVTSPPPRRAFARRWNTRRCFRRPWPAWPCCCAGRCRTPISKRSSSGWPSLVRTDPARVNLLFGLADVWDARRRYPEAADCAREANELARAQLEKRDRSYQPNEHERLVSGLIESFDPAFFSRLSGAGLETRRPVFIVGLPRSGTTLIEQILASHPQVHGAGELMLARQDFEAIPGLLDRDGEPPVACIADLTAEVVRQLADRHERQLRRWTGAKPRASPTRCPTITSIWV